MDEKLKSHFKAHKLHGLFVTNVAKMAELMEMQSGMLSWVDPREHVLHADVDVPTLRGTFGGCLADSTIVKHRVLKIRLKCELCKKTGRLILTAYLSYDVFLRKRLPFGVAITAPAFTNALI